MARPPSKHGKTCKCAGCMEARRAYMQRWRARQRGLDIEEPKRTTVEEDVRAELATMSAADSRPGLVAGALAMARILDNPRLATTHPSANRQLWQTLERIRLSSHTAKGRLAVVSQMTNRKPS
jgi:hypothetical protein